MNALSIDSAGVRYTTPATHSTVTLASGSTYYVIVVGGEGFALIQPAGCHGWEQVAINFDMHGDGGLDEVVAAVIGEAFGPLR
jgi:hypothetical protein